MKHLYWGVLALLISFTSCSTNHVEGIDPEEKQVYFEEGNHIASEAQKALLSKVTKAIADSGVNGAVAFCNENAIPITDSLSNAFHAQIKRISNKNRNPDNVLKTETDIMAWNLIEGMAREATAPPAQHVVLQEGNKIFYYKAITLGMPTCLKCHGNKDTDIAPETLQLIQAKYPNDKAIGYQLGELRGLWKIALQPAQSDKTE
ncbi:MAG: DUF3365 domain-containing protein [Chitinophagaceae bacterium]|nr:DUF3365 domain-containing protein [Chitinophagaceae bacterium]MCZ2397589.1 DUF3365 domain-containing protein [Chitinophagales bacterium]